MILRALRASSLYVQVVVIASVAALVPTGFVIYFLSGQIEREIQAGMELKARAVAGLVSSYISIPLAFGDMETIEGVMKTTKKDDDLVYVVLIDENNKVLASVGDQGGRELLRNLDSDQLEIESGGGMIDVATPILVKESPVARLQLGFSMERVESGIRRAQIAVMVAGFLLALSVIFFLTLGISRAVVRPVQGMTELARQLASGDLRTAGVTTPQGQSEVSLLGQAVEQMADSLRGQVAAIKVASEDLDDNATLVRGTTTNLVGALSSLNTAIAQATASSEEIKQTGQVSRGKATHIVDICEKSIEASERGKLSVDDATVQMNKIKDQVEDIVEDAEGLNAQLEQVGMIIESVKDIAEQSNLLAVNASIEAASAGEYGRGFSIVAQEVKNLAQQSKSAALQVDRTLNAIRKSFQEVVESSREGKKAAQEGVSVIEHTGQVINDLTEVIAETTRAATQIAINVNDQVQTLEQMAQVMCNINKTAQENLDQVTHLEQGSEKSSMLAAELKDKIMRYRVSD